jgi:hypothetical protein
MTDEETTVPEEQGEPDLGEAGKKAIKAERDRAAAAERELAALKAQYDQTTQRLGELEQTVTTRRDRRRSRSASSRSRDSTSASRRVSRRRSSSGSVGTTRTRSPPTRTQQTPADQFAASVGSLFTT